jgi:hypothetical protein
LRSHRSFDVLLVCICPDVTQGVWQCLQASLMHAVERSPDVVACVPRSESYFVNADHPRYENVNTNKLGLRAVAPRLGSALARGTIQRDSRPSHEPSRGLSFLQDDPDLWRQHGFTKFSWEWRDICAHSTAHPSWTGERAHCRTTPYEAPRSPPGSPHPNNLPCSGSP